MGTIKPKELSKLGYKDNTARSLAIEIIARHCKHTSSEDILVTLADILAHPESYKQDAVWSRLAEVIAPDKPEISTYDLRNEPLPYFIYGE